MGGSCLHTHTIHRYLRGDTLKALTDFEYLLPDQTPDNGVYVVDTGDMFAALEGEASGNKRSLERACRHLQIPTEFLHNAGNDAHVSWPLFTVAQVTFMNMRGSTPSQR